ncbi:hypothetical protein C8Q80DRAFT_1124013 [Daedaleopsis nitida]|nr:hypothetical protein C8Q80DRAFT_1124013 [Daedaleopsis nitida]
MFVNPQHPMDPVATTSRPVAEIHSGAAFTHITEGLFSIGAVPVLSYIGLPASSQSIPSTSNANAQQSQSSIPVNPEQHVTRAVARLHQTCQQAFGDGQGLRFAYEEDEAQGKRCILTIMRPNGDSQTYISPGFHNRNYDAKASVCTIAIQSGAIEFIATGKSDPSTVPTMSTPEPGDGEQDDSVKKIEDCCFGVTGGKVNPFWLNITEPKFGKTQGCALRIRLGERKSRVYSVNAIYNSSSEAKKACAEAALADGVLDFITKTWTPTDATPATDEKPKHTALTLQEFFDSLPKPFPEPVAGKSAFDINSPAWLNTAIQSNRGGRIVPRFVWTVDPQNSLHGCLLRLERPGEVKSYLADARFAKRSEAKGAVCLLAMSEGVGEYIRNVGKAIEDKLSASTRFHINNTLLPTLTSEYRKVRGPGLSPTFEYELDGDACGATMTIALAPEPTPQQVQKYTVPAEYRNRADAKLAVVLHAVEQGAIEFLRFKGKPPPPGYVPHYLQPDHQSLNRKRKNWESGDGYHGGGGGGEWSTNGYQNGFVGGGQYKKPRFASAPFQQQGQGNFPPPLPQGVSGYGQGQVGNGDGYHHNNKPGWNGQKKKQNQYQYGPKKPYGPGPGQFDGGTGYPAPSMKPGPRNVGGPSRPMQQQRHPQSFAPVPFGGAPPHLQQQLPAPSPFQFTAGGLVTGGTQPPQAPYFGPGLQGSHVPYQPHMAVAPAPFVSHPPAPGGMPQPPSCTPTPSLLLPADTYLCTIRTHISITLPLPRRDLPDTCDNAQAPAPVPAAASTGTGIGTNISTSTSTSTSNLEPTDSAFPSCSPNTRRTTISQSASSSSKLWVHDLSVASWLSKPSAYPSRSITPTTPSQPPHPPPPPTTVPSLQAPLPPSNRAPPLPPTPGNTPKPSSSKITGTVRQSEAAKPSTMAASASPAANVPNAANSTPSSASASKGGKVAIHSVAKTNVSILYDLCMQNNQGLPQWRHEIVKADGGKGEPKHKVWVVIGKTKFELPVTFTSLSQGQEKIAKKVVDQFKANPSHLSKAGK